MHMYVYMYMYVDMDIYISVYRGGAIKRRGQHAPCLHAGHLDTCLHIAHLAFDACTT